MADLTELQKATNVYNEMANTPVTYGYAPGHMPQMSGAAKGMVRQGYIPRYDPMRDANTGRRSGGGTDKDTWRYGSPSDTRRKSMGSSRAYASAATTSKPKDYSPVKFEAPGDLDLPEYKPPERDEMQERKFRREYMAPGMGQIRRQTSEAILSSKSFDNPNARALFIRKALEGTGRAIEQVAGGAQKQARAEASRRYQEDVNNYRAQWSVDAEEARAKYDADWQEALQNFQEKQWGAHAGYTVANAGAGGDAGVDMPQTGGRGVKLHGPYGGLTYF